MLNASNTNDKPGTCGMVGKTGVVVAVVAVVAAVVVVGILVWLHSLVPLPPVVWPERAVVRFKYVAHVTATRGRVSNRAYVT